MGWLAGIAVPSSSGECRLDVTDFSHAASKRISTLPKNVRLMVKARAGGGALVRCVVDKKRDAGFIAPNSAGSASISNSNHMPRHSGSRPEGPRARNLVINGIGYWIPGSPLRGAPRNDKFHGIDQLGRRSTAFWRASYERSAPRAAKKVVEAQPGIEPGLMAGSPAIAFSHFATGPFWSGREGSNPLSF